MALLQAATCASRSLPSSSNVPLRVLLSTSSRISYSAAAISRRPKIGNWTVLERRHYVYVGTEARWRWRAVSMPKTCTQRWISQSRWSVGHKGQQQLRRLSDGPRNVEAQEPKRKTPLSTLIPSHENIYTLPNILTFSRLIAAPVVGYLIIHDLHIPALGLFIYAGITDLVDGWIARKWSLQTVVGTVIDPMADKALMTVVTICLAVKEVLPVPLAIIILGRDVLLGLSAFYYRYISLPPPRTFARYWDFSLPSAEVRPTRISKINTFLQLGLLGGTMSGLAMGGLGETAQAFMEVSWWVVGLTTVWSGGSYIWGKDAVRILRKPRQSGIPKRAKEK